MMANVEQHSVEETGQSETPQEQEEEESLAPRHHLKRKRRKPVHYDEYQNDDTEHAQNGDDSISESAMKDIDIKPMSPESEKVEDVDTDSLNQVDDDNQQPRDLSYEKGVKKFVCKLCEAAFTTNSYLRVHTRGHKGEKPYTCPYPGCTAAFTSSGSLRRHENSHTKAKRYVCPECGDTFSQSSSLKTHRRKHTGERPFQCDICLRSFTSSSHMKKHRQMHSGQKPHECLDCGAQFCNYYNLKRHLMIHSGERPFMCRECGDTFITNDDLKRHSQTHSTNKPFKCQFCPMEFSRSTRWRRHELRHRFTASELALAGAHSSVGDLGDGRRLTCEEVFQAWSKQSGDGDTSVIAAGLSVFPSREFVSGSFGDANEESDDSDSWQDGGISDDDDDGSLELRVKIQAEDKNENARTESGGDAMKMDASEEETAPCQ